MKNSNLIVNVILPLILIALVLLVGTTNDRRVRKISNQLTTGYVNIILILLIVVLSCTENIQVGFMLALLFLIMLIRFNKNEGFMSGPSPLNCDTYGDSRKKNGSSYYPLHA
jgi:hypothetical protein